ncbi:hypothetical protein PBCVNEJV4_209L [Paramecium bursaria Chlorella virus NE-JV-4]|nr:hypothetical protein PBCVNEJV4_209L [Paramecium bursaria Chlorella virus NE-JV-4]
MDEVIPAEKPPWFDVTLAAIKLRINKQEKRINKLEKRFNKLEKDIKDIKDNYF